MSARTSLPLTLSFFAAALGGAGCDDSLKSVSSIEETRVLGARVEVEADSTRSSPNAGERAALHFFVAAPDGAPNFAYALSVCAVRLIDNGFPPCASAPFASIFEAEPSNAQARLQFEVPAELVLASTPHAFASGLICPDSGLNGGSAGGPPSCIEGTGTEVAFEFELGGPEQSNQSPTFAEDAIALDGEPWPANASASCDEGSLRRVTPNSLHALRIDLAESDFEALMQQTSIDPARETLLVSPFSSSGKLSHGFLSLRAETPPAQRQVVWTAPAVNLARLVRFYFVVRDARGGEDFTTRALCVVP